VTPDLPDIVPDSVELVDIRAGAPAASFTELVSPR
jgi:hypothetical protein